MNPPFTEAERQAWLILCQELLEQYRNGTHHHTTCPICVDSDEWEATFPAQNSNTICEHCIWAKLSNSDCCRYVHDMFPDSYYSSALQFMKTEEWIQFRIQHLRSWIDRLKQMGVDEIL